MEGRRKRACVLSDLALCYDTFFRFEYILDRVLNSNYVQGRGRVDMLDKRCHGCRFAGTRRSCNQYQAAFLLRSTEHDRRKLNPHVIGYNAVQTTYRKIAAVHVHVGVEAVTPAVVGYSSVSLMRIFERPVIVFAE